MFKLFFSVVGATLLAVGGLQPAAGAMAPVATATGSQTLLTITCPSVTVCYAGGNHGSLLATHDGGATWQAPAWQSAYRTNVTTIASIACPAVNDCFSLVQAGCEELGAHVPLLHTTDGGGHWAAASIQGCGSSLACPAVTTCYTTIAPTGPGYPAFVRTANSGASWQVQTRVDPGRLMESLACPAPTVCYVAFQNATGRSTDGGKHWAISRITGKSCAPLQSGCPQLNAIACPGQSTCYTGGSEVQNGRFVADVVTTDDGFRTRTSHLISGLQNITAVSCPTPSVCFALGEPYSGLFAVTRDAGRSWHVGRVTSPYPFNTLSCPSVSVCYAAGFLGRLVATRDGGATWHDLVPAIFVSGTYSARQPLHTYSGWFSATGPWQVAVSKLAGPGPVRPGGRPLVSGCRAISSVVVYVRNAQGQVVAGPIPGPRNLDGSVAGSTVQATGKLRLDVVAQCSTFGVRADGVLGLASPSLARTSRAGRPAADNPVQAVRALVHGYYYGPQGQRMQVPARFASCAPMSLRVGSCPVTARFLYRLRHPDPRPAGCMGGCTLDPVSRSQNTTQHLSMRLVGNNGSVARVDTRWGYTYNTFRFTFVARHASQGWLVDDEYCTGHPATTIYRVPIKPCP